MSSIANEDMVPGDESQSHGGWWEGPCLQDHPPIITLQVFTLRAQVLFQALDVGRQAVKRKAVTASISLPQTRWLIFQGRLIREHQAKMINKSNRHPSFNETLFVSWSLNFEIILQGSWIPVTLFLAVLPILRELNGIRKLFVFISSGNTIPVITTCILL